MTQPFSSSCKRTIR